MLRTPFILFLLLIGPAAYGQSYDELNNKVIQLSNEGKYAEAIPVALKAKEAAQKEFGDTSAAYATSMNNIAFLNETIGNYDIAKTLYIQVIAIRKKLLGEEHPFYASSLYNLAYLYVHTGNDAAAEPLFKKVLAIRKKALGEDDIDYINTMIDLAHLYDRTYRYADEEALYNELLVLVKKVSGEESMDYVSILNNLAFTYVNAGNYLSAEPLFKEALALVKKLKGEENPDYASILSNLASAFQKLGNYSAAEPLFLRSLTITEKVLGKEHNDYSNRLNNLAFLYQETGRYTAAEPLFKEALNIRKKVLGEEHPDYARVLNNLAGLYGLMGNYSAAESLWSQVLAIQKKALGEEHPEYANTLSNLAALYNDQGKYEYAEILFKEALRINKMVLGEEHPDYITSLNNLAYAYSYLGKYDDAESLYKEALNIGEKIFGEEHPYYASSLHNLAFIYKIKGNYSAAEPLFLTSLTIIKKVLGEEHPEYTADLNNLAGLYEGMGDYKKAFIYCTESADLAFRHMEKNFTALSEDEKLKWWQSVEGYFQLEPSILFKNSGSPGGMLSQAFDQQLNLKSYILNDKAKVLQWARKNSDPQMQQLLNEWQNNKAILAKQYSLPVDARISQLDSLDKITNEEEKQINQQSAAFRTNQQNLQIDSRQVQQKLKPGEAAIEFIRFYYYHKDWTDSVLYAAFVILPSDSTPHFVPLCEEKQLSGLLDSKSNSSAQYVKQLYRGIGIKGRIQTDGKKGDTLYTLIWKPLLPWLNGIKKVSIAPAGLLNRVAFNALPVDSNTYLIDKYQLRQFSSIRQIAEQKIPVQPSNNTTDITLYGGIQFNAADTTATSGNETSTTPLPDNVKRSIRVGIWNDLPGTLKEVNNIKQLFTTNKKATQIITGANATEESLKQLSGKSPSILHLATHGFSLPDADKKRITNSTVSENQFTLADNPLLRSGIIMAGANRVWNGAVPIPGKEDGIVTAYEISNMDLSNTELVVLSACETALGDIKGTEGVFGLQRAFKLAGVQNMLLSLWQVPDAETAELMNLLYANKLNGMTTYEAFNKAQDAMRKKYPPYYWAAFVLIE
ncbi:MAG: tetratricopeptide repeat protein [Chitinophagaceae bacterium]|nr:MAG: tetratricopeptide repeat protein [Chitinophagaceae bacterium]